MKQHIKRSTAASVLLAGVLGSLSTASIACSSEPFMASVCIMIWPKTDSFGGSLYMAASGQTLPVNQYQALYSLIGNTYGGTAPTSFNLPDLRGRTIVGVGQGPGLPFYNYGATGGAIAVQLTTAQLPPHAHTLGTGVQVTTGPGNMSVSVGIGTLAANTTLGNLAGSVSGSSLTLNGSTGGNFGTNASGSSLGSYSSTTKIYSDAAPNVGMKSGAISGTANVAFTGTPSTTLSGTPTVTMTGGPAVIVGGTTNPTGSGSTVPTLSPFAALVYYIATGGIYPTPD